MDNCLKNKMMKLWREWIKPFLIIATIMFSFRSAVADWNDVPSGSMKPTILEGDRIFVNKLAYDLKIPFTTWHIWEWGEPERGDIVVFFSPADEKRLVKRVIGVPGDKIEMKDGQIYINGEEQLYEPIDDEQVVQFENNLKRKYSFVNETLGCTTHLMMISKERSSVRSFGPVHLKENQYFMMGDNRDRSYDSRYFGFVDRDRIVGRVLAVALSVDPENYYIPRWNRFFSGLQ